MYIIWEMEYQFNDVGCKVLVVLVNFGDVVVDVLLKIGIKYVIIIQVVDMQLMIKWVLMNFVIKYIKKMVLDFKIKGVVLFIKVMSFGGFVIYKEDVNLFLDDVVVL